MKTIYRKELPDCDICHKVNGAEYDVPTKMGPWGNLCQECFDQHAASNAREMGTKFMTKKPEPKKPIGKRLAPKMLTSMQDAVNNSIVELMCPICSYVQSMEVDAGDYDCHNCNQKLHWTFEEVLY